MKKKRMPRISFKGISKKERFTILEHFRSLGYDIPPPPKKEKAEAIEEDNDQQQISQTQKSSNAHQLGTHQCTWQPSSLLQ